MRIQLTRLFVALVLALGAGGLVAGHAQAATTASAHSASAKAHARPLTENGGPGQCTAARDGQTWTNANGVKFICTYYKGAWQWVVATQCDAPAVAGKESVHETRA